MLITGRPGCGKTTLLREVVDALGTPAGGFYTRELRDGSGRRAGFELVTLDGRTATLAHTGTGGPHRVGRYGVDIEALERAGVPAIEAAVEAGQLVVIDEIGKMELLSTAFQRAVIAAVRRYRVLFGTVMLAAHPFADELKAQPDTLLFELNEANRAQLRGLLEAQLRAALGQLSV
ncbi:MAG: AAA family ATPase [Chloroflexi bacterium]|nr:AAA family ATPase [Chloroflexota bacterium]